MNKGTRYLLAFIACALIFIVYIIFQEEVAKGMLVSVFFVGAMIATWKAIVGTKKDKDGETKE